MTAPVLASSTNNIANYATSISVNKPSGVAEGDLLIVVCTTDGTGSALTGPSDFNVLFAEQQLQQITHASWWKIATASEPASYSVSWSGGEDAVIGCFRITGWDSGDFPHKSAASNGSGTSRTIFPAVSPTRDECLIFRCFGMDDDDDTEPVEGCPGDHTELYARCSTSSSGECTGAACWIEKDAGNTGTATWAHASSEGWIANTLAIAPPSEGPTPGWNPLEYESEPPPSGWQKLLYASEPPVPASWNKLKYKP